MRQLRHSGSFILLKQNKKNSKNMMETILQVFDEGGTWIGEISNPDYIPKKTIKIWKHQIT